MFFTFPLLSHRSPVLKIEVLEATARASLMPDNQGFRVN